MVHLPWRIKELDFIGLGGQSNKQRKRAEQEAKDQERRKREDEERERVARDIAFGELSRPKSKEEQDAEDLREREIIGRDRAEEEERRKKHKEDAMDDLNTPMTGLTPQQRLAMEERANKQIGAQLQNYSRMLASAQGSRGIRGGKAQADLRRQALSAQGDVMNSLNIKDADLAMQRLAAYLNSVEGRGAQDLLHRQQTRDRLWGEQDRRRQAARDLYYDRYFNKV
jgi:hypothetical protein